MEDFKEELKIFEIESNDSSRKMNTGKMWDKLIILHPNKFSIPSELCIKQFISLQNQKSKYVANRNFDKRKNVKQKEEWQLKLDELVTNNSKPSDIYVNQILLLHYPKLFENVFARWRRIWWSKHQTLD